MPPDGTEQTTDPQGAIDAFYVRPPSLPALAEPVYDDESRAVVGFVWESATGVFKIYDIEGRPIGIEEVGLESPLFDPIDLIFLLGGLFRIATKGLVGAARGVGRIAVATRGTTAALARTVAVTLRASFRRVTLEGMKFTVKTAGHMGNPGRLVPKHILHLAIKYGKKAPDPKGVAGVFQYSIKMSRAGKAYTLKVVYRAKDQTILHFHYD